MRIGVKINGIINIGFNTIGKPNVIVSLILNSPGAKDSLAIVRWSERFDASSIANNSQIVQPAPPIVVKQLINVSFKINCGV